MASLGVGLPENEARAAKPRCVVSQPGAICHAPNSWLRELIRGLPAREKLVLFRTCRSLARHVVHSTHNIKMCFGHTGQAQPASILKARRIVISSLLDGCLGIHVVLQTNAAQPIPLELSSKITKLTLALEWHAEGPATANFSWGMFQNLQEIAFQQYVQLPDVNALCEAVLAGQLPALCSMELLPKQCIDPSRGEPVGQRLAEAVGRQIVDLTTNSALQLLKHLKHFTSLEAVTFQACPGKEELQQLCQHPTLRSVTFGVPPKHVGVFFRPKKEDCSHFECKWDTVTFHSVNPAVMAAVPLASVKSIRLVHAVSLCNFEKDRQALQQVLEVCRCMLRTCSWSNGLATQECW